MQLKVLAPPNLPRPNVRCEADLVHVTGWTEYWHEQKKAEAKRTGRGVYKCTRRAFVEVDGKPYCSLHCGPVLVAKLQEEKTILDRIRMGELPEDPRAWNDWITKELAK